MGNINSSPLDNNLIKGGNGDNVFTVSTGYDVIVDQGGHNIFNIDLNLKGVSTFIQNFDPKKDIFNFSASGQKANDVQSLVNKAFENAILIPGIYRKTGSFFNVWKIEFSQDCVIYIKNTDKLENGLGESTVNKDTSNVTSKGVTDVKKFYYMGMSGSVDPSIIEKYKDSAVQNNTPSRGGLGYPLSPISLEKAAKSQKPSCISNGLSAEQFSVLIDSKKVDSVTVSKALSK